MDQQFFTKNGFGPIRNSVKNRNVSQKSKFRSKYKFQSNSIFRYKIEISVKNLNFGIKSKFRSKIGILVKNRNYGVKFKF